MALHSLWDTLLCFLQTCSLLLCGRRQAPAHTFPSAASKTPFNLSSSILPAEEQCPSVQARTVFLSYISRTLSQARMSFLSPRNTSATATADDSLVSAELGQSPLSKTRLDFLFSTTVSRTQQHSTTGGLGSPLSVSSSSPLNRSFLPVSPILPVTPTSAVERSMQHAETDFSIAVLPGPTCHDVKIEDSPPEKSMTMEPGPEADSFLISPLVMTPELSLCHTRSFSLVSPSYSEIDSSMDSSPNLRAALASYDSKIEYFSALRIFEPIKVFPVAPPIPMSLVSSSGANSRSRSKSSPVNPQSVISTIPAQYPDPTQTSVVLRRDKRHTLSWVEALPLLDDAIRMSNDADEELEEDEVVISPFWSPWAGGRSDTSLCALSDY